MSIFQNRRGTMDEKVLYLNILFLKGLKDAIYIFCKRT
jgi:hypothetical protein